MNEILTKFSEIGIIPVVVLNDVGCIIGNSSNHRGGGFFNAVGEEDSERSFFGTFLMNGGRIDANTAGLIDEHQNDGGGVYNVGNFTMNNGCISGNYAAGYGGGLHTEVMATINGGRISNNSTVRGGGVNNTIDGVLILNGGDIVNNTARKTGGGVRNCYGDGIGQIPRMYIHGGNISYNSAGLWGGGIINADSRLEIDEEEGKVTISHNTAGVEGGGIENNDGSTLIIRSGSITDNISHGTGGGIYSYAETKVTNLTITGGYIAGNHADDRGGGVHTSFIADETTVCDLFVSGSPVIKGNTSGDGIADNVYLEPYDEMGLQRYITLSGNLMSGADIHISYPVGEGEQFGLISDGYAATTSDLGYFHADYGSLSAKVTEDKTLVWVKYVKPASSSSKNEGTSVWLTAAPTPEPTLTPTPAPTPEVPTVKPTEKPTQTPASPVPLAGLLAGLGAAFAAAGVCRRK